MRRGGTAEGGLRQAAALGGLAARARCEGSCEGLGARLARTSFSAKRCERVPKPSRSLLPVKRVVSNFDGMELACFALPPACPAMKPVAAQREGRAQREARASGGVWGGGPLFTLPPAFFPTCR